MTFGPGVAWAIANMSVNCWSVIQRSTSTTRRCISGTAELAPPIANSDISAKCAASESSVPDPSFIAAPRRARC